MADFFIRQEQAVRNIRKVIDIPDGMRVKAIAAVNAVKGIDMDRQRHNEKVDRKALEIAAQIMRAADLCRYEDKSLCRREHTGMGVCEGCIRAWLVGKAVDELCKGE